MSTLVFRGDYRALPTDSVSIPDKAVIELVSFHDRKRYRIKVAYSHAWRSLNNIHADHVITSMPITQ